MRAAGAEAGTRLVILMTVFSLIAFAVAIVLGFQQSIRAANTLDRDNERKLAANYLALAGKASVAQQTVQLTWDDGFKAAGIGQDFGWADTYLGDFLWTSFHYDRLYLIDSQGGLLRGWAHGKPAPAADFDGVSAAVLRQMATIETRGSLAGQAAELRQLADTRWPFDSSGRPLTRYATALVALEGKPAILTVASLLPDNDYSLLRRSPNYLVSLRQLDDDYLAMMSQAILLRGIAFSTQDRADSRINSLALTGDGGSRLGWLHWESTSRAALISRSVRPLFIAFICFLLAVVGGGYAIVRALVRALAGLRLREAQARHQAFHDVMTGLPNRMHFSRELAAEIERRRDDPGAVIVVAYFDLDNFKDINDTRGYHCGDGLIEQVVRRCSLRLGANDVFARFGGDEFVVLRVYRAGERGVAKTGDDIMAIFAAPFLVAGEPIDITASCGISWAPEHGGDPDELLRQADIALAQAKRRGRARWRAFQPAMKDAVHRRHEIETGLRRAITRDELSVAYQPIVSADDGRIVGVESLLRWHHPDFGDISPSVFIPIAEQAGLMASLGSWLLRRVLSERLLWPQLDFSVNLSPIQLMTSNFAEELRELCVVAGIKPSRITLEVTESVLMQRGEGVFERLERLKRMGFRIALDDFGTGYSSLSYLRAFHFDSIKVDRCFVQDIENDPDARAILRAIVSLGRALDAHVVAEGVETLHQRELVVASGCDFIQGHLYWPALTAPEVRQLLDQQSLASPLRKAS